MNLSFYVHNYFEIRQRRITGFSWGGKEHLQKKYKLADRDRIIFQPTKSRVELLMWTYGYGQDPVNDFLIKT